MDRILDKQKTEAVTGLSRSTIWRLERSLRFPRRRLLSDGRVGWFSSEVEAWLQARPAPPCPGPKSIAATEQ